MIIDARTLPEGQDIQVDVCIVGAGAAGITLARELSGQPFRIALIAGGGLTTEQATSSLNAGTNVGLRYFPLEHSRARMFGGTTAWWGGTCRPLSDFDFEARDWIPMSGWPVDSRELLPYRLRAERLCKLRSTGWGLEEMAVASGFEPLRLNPKLLETRIAQVIAPSALRRFGTVYRHDIAAAPNVDTYLNASVVEIETDESSRTVRRLHLACLKGPRLTLVPKICILAAGGIENPRLLLASSRVSAAGVGNQYDLVGRYFLEHPRFTAGMFYPLREHARSMLYGPQLLANGTPIKSYIAPTPELMRKERLNDVQLRLSDVYTPTHTRSRNSLGFAALRKLVTGLRDRQMPGQFGSQLVKVLGDIDSVAVAAYFTAFGGGTAGPMVVTSRIEPVPNSESRVTLTDGRDELGMPRVQLDWRLSEQDKRSARRAMEVFASEVGKTGLGRVQILLEDDGSSRDWPESLEGGWHHMGTTRMADNPRQGVVDRNCRVHGMSNLWIAGSSVFPTAGSGTPTLMIITLAVRLAEEIKQRMA